jgi:hypothetical protein
MDQSEIETKNEATLAKRKTKQEISASRRCKENHSLRRRVKEDQSAHKKKRAHEPPRVADRALAAWATVRAQLA